jgi:hypothetical protein
LLIAFVQIVYTNLAVGFFIVQKNEIGHRLYCKCSLQYVCVYIYCI